MDKMTIWEQACSVMRTEMTQVTFDTWIKAALKPLDFSGDQFFIEAVTDFYHQFVVPRYAVLIGNSLSQVMGRQVKAQILTPSQAQEYREGVTPVDTRPAENAGLNPKYTFDTFTHEKAVLKKSRLFDFKFRYPPYTEKKLNTIKKLLK